MCEQAAVKFVAQMVDVIGSNPEAAFAVAERVDVASVIFFLPFLLVLLSVCR